MMGTINTRVLKETLWIVGTGLVVNYPISVLTAWVLIDLMAVSSAFWIATNTTVVLTVVALVRVYTIRTISERVK